jgi:hypothetical protein
VSSKLSKQEERHLQRKELGLMSEASWKGGGGEGGVRTRAQLTKSIPKLATPSAVTLPPGPVGETKGEKHQSTSRAAWSASLRGSHEESVHSAPVQSSQRHSNALQSAAQKAVAIFTSRISSKKTSTSTTSTAGDDSSASSSSQPSSGGTRKRAISQSSGTSVYAQAPRTPSNSSISTQKTKTPSSTHRSSVSSTSLINVQRTVSSSALSTSTPTSSKRRSIEATTTVTTPHLKSTVIRATGGHQFKPKSVASTSSGDLAKGHQGVPPPTLRGGGGRNSKAEINSVPSVSVSSESTEPSRQTSRTKPTVPVRMLQSKNSSSDDKGRQLKHMSSSIASLESEEKVSKTKPPVASAPSTDVAVAPASIRPAEPAVNPFGALIQKTPPREG